MAWDDFIERFMLLTDGVNSPDQFRLWTAISVVAGACERRVWARAAKARTYPNLYVLLTAAPGVGKQVISLARQLWKNAPEAQGSNVKAFRVAPTQMTKASLIDSIAKAKQFKITKAGNLTYHSMLIAAEEFQVLLPTYDTEYISALNEIFNCPDLPYEEVRRTGSVKEISIENPQLNLLGGVQPSYFVSTFPEEAWTTGFARRIIMVYAAEGKFQELFQDSEEIVGSPIWNDLLQSLTHISTLYGQMAWEPEAAEKLADWHRAKGPPAPTHSKLVHYNNSRTMFAIKLSTISAVSRSGKLVIQGADVTRALAWLKEAESRMPDVFREMIGKSDTQVIDELHYMMVLEQGRSKGKALPTSVLWEFLRQRVPSEKIERILISAERSGIITKPAGATDLWFAKPIRTVRGVE